MPSARSTRWHTLHEPTKYQPRTAKSVAFCKATDCREHPKPYFVHPTNSASRGAGSTSYWRLTWEFVSVDTQVFQHEFGNVEIALPDNISLQS